ncbi:MAG: hypothetical protein KJO42_15530 [Silicimonas sp.]|nr:hypothetical protein [Silicimonas sp.]NND20421.1 hypothetical protein [Silicimonas sp.]RZW05986.1 MAG: hypothetical protein EX266_08205 [Paracoccaceae bacterium]
MSNQDSFIDEVTDEVRKDRLYALYRKYGWVAALAVILLVGGAAANEWRKASARAQAEAAGDALLTALENETPEARAEAMAALEAPEDAGRRAITLLLRAGTEAELGNKAAAREALDTVAADEALSSEMRDLATLKSVILSSDEVAPEDRIARLSPIAVPGSPYRLLALEQIALAEIETGDTDKALETLTGIAADAGVTQDLRTRVTQLIVALGGEISAG